MHGRSMRLPRTVNLNKSRQGLRPRLGIQFVSCHGLLDCRVPIDDDGLAAASPIMRAGARSARRSSLAVRKAAPSCRYAFRKRLPYGSRVLQSLSGLGRKPIVAKATPTPEPRRCRSIRTYASAQGKCKGAIAKTAARDRWDDLSTWQKRPKRRVLGRASCD